MATIERRILDALPHLVCTADLDGRVTGVNRAPTRLGTDMGEPALDEAEPVGMPVRDVLAVAGPREQVDDAMALLRTGRSQIVTWEVVAGTPPESRAVLVHATPLLDAGAVVGFCFSVVDTTISHRTHETAAGAGVALARTVALDRVYQEAAQQARRALGAEAVAIALADDETATLRIAHQAGYAENPSATGERLRSAWVDALAGDGPVWTQSAPGTELTVPLAGAEGVIGTMTVVVDGLDSHQDRRDAERHLAAVALQAGAAIERAWLVQASEQKKRLAAIGEVAAGVAQELRNPLFGISSAAQLLRFRARDDPVIEKNIGRILREVERMNRMSTSLLEYGRPNPLRLTPGDPDAVWDDVIEAERGRLESSAIAIVRTRATPPARCLIDATQLAQALGNVLVNAIEAAPEASDVSLVAEVLPTGAWRCRLRNGGEVVAPDALAHAFEIFQSTRPGAAGLGLPIARRVVEEHGGRIALESATDVGTTATIVLPPAP